MHRGPIALLALLLAAALVAAGGCGGDGGGESVASGAETARQEAQPKPKPKPKPPLIEAGDHVVFIGDSLSVTSPPTYADLLPVAVGDDAADVTVTNLSQPGTTTSDWLAGSDSASALDGVKPELERADLVVVTLGGNDLQVALGGADGIDALSGSREASAATELLTAIERFGDELSELIGGIRRLAPGAEIVYVSYPDYSQSSAWQEAGGSLGSLALSAGLAALLQEARGAGADHVVDMRSAATERDVDALLADTEHLSTAGHELYARKLAQILTRARR